MVVKRLTCGTLQQVVLQKMLIKTNRRQERYVKVWQIEIALEMSRNAASVTLRVSTSGSWKSDRRCGAESQKSEKITGPPRDVLWYKKIFSFPLRVSLKLETFPPPFGDPGFSIAFSVGNATSFEMRSVQFTDSLFRRSELQGQLCCLRVLPAWSWWGPPSIAYRTSHASSCAVKDPHYQGHGSSWVDLLWFASS